MSVSRLLAEDVIQRVVTASSIAEIVGAYVTLKKAGSTYTALCPFHKERSASFTVTPARQSFKCFGCGAGGDVIRFVTLVENIGFRDAVQRLADRAGIPIIKDDSTRQSKARQSVKENPPAPLPPPIPPPVKHLLLPVGLHRGKRGELKAVADRRGLSLTGVELASARGLLWFGAPKGVPGWIVTDRARVNAQARRMDGGLWEHIGDKKAWTLPGSRAAWPIGVRESEDFPSVVIVEGGPDLLAAHHFIVAEGREKDVAAVGMLGASNHIPEDALLFLAHKRVRIFSHADPAGQEAAVRWTEELERVGAEADAFRFDGLQRSDGGAVKDLNDMAHLDADCFEAERTDLERILPQ